MKEQSHKAEMATALRGDFARLRARGVATTLPTPPLVAVEAEAAPAALPPTDPSATESATEPPTLAPATTVSAVAEPLREPEDAAAPAVETGPATDAEPRSATSWLDRLRGR